MANGPNTARASNATNGTFSDEPAYADYARVTSGQDPTEIERSREQTRRLDKEREEREKEEEEKPKVDMYETGKLYA